MTNRAERRRAARARQAPPGWHDVDDATWWPLIRDRYGEPVADLLGASGMLGKRANQCREHGPTTIGDVGLVEAFPDAVWWSLGCGCFRSMGTDGGMIPTALGQAVHRLLIEHPRIELPTGAE